MGLIGKRLRGPGLRFAALRLLAAAAAGVAASRQPFPWAAAAVLAFGGVLFVRKSRGRSLYLLLGAAVLVRALVGVPGGQAGRPLPASEFRGRVDACRALEDGCLAVVTLVPDGRVMLTVRDTLAGLKPGDEVLVRAEVEPFSHPRNPGLRDRNDWYRERGFVGRAAVDSRRVVVVAHGRNSWFAGRVVRPCREALSRAMARYLPDADRALLASLLLGERQDLPAEVRDAFRDAGILHVLAVSGLHVGVVVGVVWLLLGVLGIRGWWRFGVATAVLLGYVVLTGARTPVVRAAVMAGALLVAGSSQRRPDPLASIGVAGLVILLWRPGELFEPGFQLSFAATLAILFFARRYGGRLARHGRLRLLRRAALALAVSSAAFVGTAPLLLHHFHRLQLLAPVASVPAVLLVSVAVPLGFLVGAIHTVSGVLAGMAAGTLSLVLAALRWLAVSFAGQQWAMLEPGRLPWPEVLLAYGLLGLAWNWRRQWCRAGFRLGFALTLNGLVWRSALARPAARALFMDPGRGDAVLLEDELGRRVLFDAGIDRTGVLRDYLLCRGVRRLDVVVITHPDIDHYGGLLDLGRGVTIARVVVPTVRGGSAYVRLLERLARAGTEVIVAGDGTHLTGFGFAAEFIWPEPPARILYERGMVAANNVSLVALVERRGYRMLLTGDLDEPELIAAGGVDVELVKSPHHGSRTGNSELLYEVTSPEFVVVMGRYPTPAGLEQRLAYLDDRYVNTREEGALTLRFGPGGPQAIRYRSGSSRQNSPGTNRKNTETRSEPPSRP